MIKLLGIFGYPIKHSLSPYMHNAVCHELSLPYFYVPFQVAPEKLGQAVDSIRTLGIQGINITIPHKESVMQYLDKISHEAKLIGAVNTIKNENGKLIGYNTDGRGFVASIKEDFDVMPKGKSFIILGAGGAARAIAIQLAIEGCSKIIIANRSLSKAKNIAENINANVPSCIAEAVELNSSILVSGADMLINTTSIGMKKEDQSIVDPELLSAIPMVSDIIYNPPDTPLLKEARKRNAQAANGINMLVFQGAIAFEIWTGVTPPIKTMRSALDNELKKLDKI